MKRMSSFFRFVMIAARSPALSTAGPDVVLMFTPISAATMFASVVFPSPGGPYSKMWSSASPRFLEAAIAIDRFPFTLS